MNLRSRLTRMVDLALGGVLGGLYIYAACRKLLGPSSALESLSLVFGPGWTPAGLLLLAIATELALGWALLFWSRRRLAGGASVLLLGVFSAFLLVVHARDPAQECGCFGLSDSTITASLTRNGIMAIASLGVMLLPLVRWGAREARPSPSGA